MNTLLNNKDKIFNIKTKVENNDPSLYEHKIINNIIIDDNTISIVMTSSNRSKQTYFTLSSILTSSHKNIHIIIVDDSDKDPIQFDVLQKYPYYIDLINIHRTTKNWHNPLVNYNIGFQFIKGSKIIIQNAEVCHVGNVLECVNAILSDDKYFVFDVKATLSYEANEQIYKSDISNVNIYNEPSLHNMWAGWYQGQNCNRCFHFLTAMNRKTFDKVKNFSYDMTMGSSWDDDDFLLKIISKNISVVNVFNNHGNNVGGIHLFHGVSTSTQGWDTGVELNNILFERKKCFFNKTKKYIDICEDYTNFDENYKLLYTM